MGTLVVILKRKELPDRTEGTMYIQDLAYVPTRFCDTLEDVNRDLNRDGDLNDTGEGKVYGQTCIPYDTYELDVTYSPKFGKEMIEVKNVKGFSGIRFHWGRTILNSLGCVLLGRKDGEGTLEDDGSSKYLTALVKCRIKKGEKVYFRIEKA
jgi:hypothetical protein